MGPRYSQGGREHIEQKRMLSDKETPFCKTPNRKSPVVERGAMALLLALFLLIHMN